VRTGIERIETDRLVLRRWDPDDAGPALAVFGDPRVTPWLTPDQRTPPTVEGMRARIETWNEEDRSRGDGASHWAVLTNPDHVVGALALTFVPVDGENLTLSWALSPDAWGHGYAVEACTALLRTSMHEAGVGEVFAIVTGDNARAEATARRLGMDHVMDIGRRYTVYRVRHSDLAVLGDDVHG
jgi:RimJ/RimL family protein N-acetyltransferase